MDVLNQPPSQHPRYDEHPDQVGPSTTICLDKLEGAGVYEVVPISFAQENLAYISARWERRWVWNKESAEWEVKSRYVAREFKAMDPTRDDLFVPGAAHSTGRVIDFVAAKEDMVTVEVDAVDAHYNAEETEPVYVNAPAEFLQARRDAGLDDQVAWRLRKQLPGRRAAGSHWNDHVSSLLWEQGFLRCPGAPQFYLRLDPRSVIEVHVDDGHFAGDRDTAVQFVKDLREYIKLKGGDINELYCTYSHLKRPRQRVPGGSRIFPNPKYLQDAARAVGLVGCKSAPTPSPANLLDML